MQYMNIMYVIFHAFCLVCIYYLFTHFVVRLVRFYLYRYLILPVCRKFK